MQVTCGCVIAEDGTQLAWCADHATSVGVGRARESLFYTVLPPVEVDLPLKQDAEGSSPSDGTHGR